MVRYERCRSVWEAQQLPAASRGHNTGVVSVYCSTGGFRYHPRSAQQTYALLWQGSRVTSTCSDKLIRTQCIHLGTCNALCALSKRYGARQNLHMGYEKKLEQVGVPTRLLAAHSSQRWGASRSSPPWLANAPAGPSLYVCQLSISQSRRSQETKR